MMNVPAEATPMSFEKAMIGTRAGSATAAAAVASSPISGPRISLLPSAIARVAATAGPAAVS